MALLQRATFSFFFLTLNHTLTPEDDVTAESYPFLSAVSCNLVIN